MLNLLTVICWFNVAAGTWLGVMENVLRHEGYAGRTAIAACIAIQSLATLLFISKNGSPVFRIALATGAVAVIWLGFSSILKVLGAAHFEGFVLVIGAALVVQGALTVMTLLRPRISAT